MFRRTIITYFIARSSHKIYNFRHMFIQCRSFELSVISVDIKWRGLSRHEWACWLSKTTIREVMVCGNLTKAKLTKETSVASFPLFFYEFSFFFLFFLSLFNFLFLFFFNKQEKVNVVPTKRRTF